MSGLILGGESFIASGTIQPNVFVSLDTANAGQVLQATAGGIIWGVSARWSDAPTIYGGTPPPCAVAGEEIGVYVDDTNAQLLIGTGGCNVGDKLKSDANGAGITTTTSGDQYGAFARQTCLAGDICQVKVKPGVVH
jgi:hypothetical protein